MKEAELLNRAEAALDATCGCDRVTCPVCRLRNEIAVYLDNVMPERHGARQEGAVVK